MVRLRILAWFQKGRRARGRREPGGGTPKGSGKSLPRGNRPRVPALAGVIVLATAALAAGVVLLTGRPEVPPAPPFSSVTVGFVWPEYPGEIRLTDDALLSRLAEALAHAPARASAGPGEPPDRRRLYWRLELEGKGAEPTELLATRELRVYDPVQATLLESPELGAILSELTGALHRSFFGDQVPWDRALRLLPVGGTASIRDIETGLVFQVRRHRGDAHADVEPLTAEDTETLRAVYGGEWSWKRRAVVATVQDQAIAASINGMPHGWGDLFDNQFVGHFCLHFTGSRVHTTWRVDDGHQLMVLKAAGALADTLDTSDPEELARWIMAAVNHRELATLRHVADALDPELRDALFSQIRTLFVWGTRRVAGDETSARVQVEVTVYYAVPDPNTPYRRSPVLEFHRDAGQGPWLLSFGTLAQLLRHSPAAAGEGFVSGLDDPSYRSFVESDLELPALLERLGGPC